MLEFNVAQLEKSPIGTTREHALDDRLDMDGQEITIKGVVQLVRTNRSVLAKANLTTDVPLECCRCLEEFNCPLHVEFQEEFFPTLDVLSGLPIESGDEEENFNIDEHHVLDITEAVRQYVILSQPMKPLCQPDCGGIVLKQAS